MIFKKYVNEIDFLIRNYFLSMPAPWSPPWLDGGRLSAKQVDGHALKLGSSGITSIPGFLGVDEIAAIKDAIKSAFDERTGNIGVEKHPDSKMMVSYLREPLLVSEKIENRAFDPDLLNICGQYFRRPVILADSDLRRVHSTTMEDLAQISATVGEGMSSSNWHYDNRGKQIKVMFYLDDVKEGDQNFSFCPGTHKGLKYTNPKRTRFSDDWVSNNIDEVLEVYATAGTALIFDTQAIHRLRRKPGKDRDTFTFYYNSGYLQSNQRKINAQTYNKLPERFRKTLVPV